jgi:hypothetical protein
VERVGLSLMEDEMLSGRSAVYVTAVNLVTCRNLIKRYQIFIETYIFFIF